MPEDEGQMRDMLVKNLREATVATTTYSHGVGQPQNNQSRSTKYTFTV